MNIRNPFTPIKFKKESELWKENWKEIYRPWIFFFIATIVVLIMITIGFIAFSFVRQNEILDSYRSYINVVNNGQWTVQQVDDIVNTFTRTYQFAFQYFTIIYLVFEIGLLSYFIYSLILSKKNETLRYLSIGISTLMGFLGVFIIFMSTLNYAYFSISENAVFIYWIFLGVFSILFWFYPTKKIKGFKMDFVRSYHAKIQEEQLKEMQKNGGINLNNQNPFDIMGNIFAGGSVQAQTTNSNSNNINPENREPEKSATYKKNKEKLEDLSTEQLHLLSDKLLISGHEDMKRNELLTKILDYMELEENDNKSEKRKIIDQELENKKEIDKDKK